jgi:[ribosomal protein S5]-alanine N-acetyltransferase
VTPFTLKTSRLQLVPFEPAWSLALIESEESFQRTSGFRAANGLRDFLVSGDVPETYLESLRYARGVDPWVHGFAAVHGESGLVVGVGGFKGPPEHGVVEIAYAVTPAFERQGYATEIAKALITYAFEDGRVLLIRAQTLPEPNASTHVLLKCGFVHVGEVMDPHDGRVWRWDRAAPESARSVEQAT